MIIDNTNTDQTVEKAKPQPKASVFTFVQFEYNPQTNESLNFTENNIIQGIARKTIKEYAYIRHDKDLMELKQNDGTPYKVPKPPHWHCVIKCVPKVSPDTIAKWFNIPVNLVHIAKGRGAFLDCIEYLTHEDIRQQEAGKYLYPDEEVTSNIDFRKQLRERTERKLKYGRDLTEKEEYRYNVLYNGKTLGEIKKEDTLAYLNDYKELDRLRLKYINENAPLPPVRFTNFIYGKGGMGKGLLSKAKARSLYPNVETDSDIFFETGGDKVGFEGYDGQPVIIWNDVRGEGLAKQLGGAEQVLNILDPVPTEQRINIKYGSIKLINQHWILNSSESFEQFIEGVFKSVPKEDRIQLYRRIQFMTIMRQDDFDFLINKGFMNDTRDFKEYVFYKNFTVNMQKLYKKGQGNKELIRQAERIFLEPITAKYKELTDNRTVQNDTTLDEMLNGIVVADYDEESVLSIGKDLPNKAFKGRRIYHWIEICKNCRSSKEHNSKVKPAYENYEDGKEFLVSGCEDCGVSDLPF